jgi:hypothetical protein
MKKKKDSKFDIANSEEERNVEIFEVAWPRGPSAVKIIPLAKRLDTLAGKTIGEMWDWIFRGDEIFPVVEKELADRYPGVKFVSYKEFGNPHSANEPKVYEELPALAQKHGCDAFIVGVGC